MAQHFDRFNLAVAIGGLLVVLYLFSNDLALGVAAPCLHNQRFYPECVDNYNYKIDSCNEFGYPETSVHGCGSGESCKYGNCMPTTCLEGAQVCATDFSALSRECLDGKYIDTLLICERGTRCENGSCIAGAGACGDGICDSNETVTNCYQDCWSLSSWEALAKQVSDDPSLAEFTKCSGVFDCSSPEVTDKADFIYRSIADKTPKGYVDAVAGFSYNYVTYTQDKKADNVAQCGTSASSLIHTKDTTGTVKGNCVDKSTLMVALLRAKGIPARQVGGCLSQINFECQAYSIAGVPLEYGGMNDAQPLAHAYLQVWADPSIGWAIADPTMGKTMSKCVGYYSLNFEGRDHQQMCYLDSAYIAYCKQV